MPVTFYTCRGASSLNNIQSSSVTLNESRIQRLMSGKKEEALYMGPLDRLRDLSRPEKKADVLEAFCEVA